MNAGTYLGEFKDITTRVCSLSLQSGELISRSNAECEFVYRGSSLPRTEIVVEAEFEFKHRDRSEIEKDVKSLKVRRKEREPEKVSNAGSTFKNPVGDYAGRLIEVAGLKGTHVGAALCSEKHANWLVNTGGATATDFIALVQIVRDKVKEVHQVELQLEIKIVGTD